MTFGIRPEGEEVSLWGRLLSRGEGQCKTVPDKQGRPSRQVGQYEKRRSERYTRPDHGGPF